MYKALYLSSIIFLGLLFGIESAPFSLTREEVVLIYFIGGMVILIDHFPILLPSNQSLFLNSTIFIATSLVYGLRIAFWVILISYIHILLLKKSVWWKLLFNLAQFSLIIGIGLYFYENAGGVVGSFNYENPIPFILFCLIYMIGNAVVISGYFHFAKEGKFTHVFTSLFRESSLNYLMMIIYSFILIMIFNTSIYIGSTIFLIMILLTADNYKKYFQLLEKTKKKANLDELTGIYNHRYFQYEINEKIKQASKDKPLSLLFIDIDYFKKINDRYGHQVGDYLLRQVADRIKEKMPEEYIFARYGGEEFIVLIPNCTSTEALRFANLIREDIYSHEFETNSSVSKEKISISIGISTYPLISKDKESLIKNADQALYVVKYLGRNQCRVYSIKDDAPKAVPNIRSEQELQELIESINGMLRAKDKPTYDHEMRVYQYSMAFAEWLNLAPEDRRILQMGSILHDIGKMEVPREILNKKERLTEIEWEWIKKHAEYGEGLLSEIEELKKVLPLIRHHHERYDGKGYPDQLKGQEIPYLARILTITDSFDAMTTNRSYQQTKTYTEAIRELQRCSGTQFDPILLTEFISMLERIRDQEDSILKHVEGL